MFIYNGEQNGSGTWSTSLKSPPPSPHHKVKNRLSFPKLGFFCNTASGRGDYTVHAKESEDSQISLTEVVANTYILQGSRKSQ